jgi:NADH:ubiquinone oxidoreductase subunit 5 (subunit L)/multisubunit Na+/H+ antiporter MnhA subunit
MMTALFVLFGAALFVAGLGLAIGAIAHSIHARRDAPDVEFNLGDKP